MVKWLKINDYGEGVFSYFFRKKDRMQLLEIESSKKAAPFCRSSFYYLLFFCL